jgi:hypothetical protein
VRFENKHIFFSFVKRSSLLQLWSFSPEANPAIANYNASVVKIYSATNSMARF